MLSHLKQLLLVGALALAACGAPTEFSSPLGPAAPAAEQKRLVGLWANIDSGSSMFLHVYGRVSGDLAGQLVYLDTSDDLEPETQPQPALSWAGTGYVTQLDGSSYVVFRRTDGVGDSYTAPSMEPGYSLFRVRFDGPDRFWLTNFNSDVLEKAGDTIQIDVQELTGSNRHEEEISYFYATLDTETLQKLIRSVGAAGWDKEEAPFQRMLPVSEKK